MILIVNCEIKGNICPPLSSCLLSVNGCPLKLMEALITYYAEAQQNMVSGRSLLEHVQWFTMIIAKGADHAQSITKNT